MKKLLLSLSLLLTACQEEEAPKAQSVQKIDNDFYKLKAIPKAEPIIGEPEYVPEPEPVVIPEVDFPDPRPLLREKKARELRGRRAYKVRLHNARSLPQEKKEPEEWQLEEEHYQQGETTFNQDLSTLPVDRTRILTADMRIPAIIEDSINTQTLGRLIAVIDRDVLSPNGKKILLPAYSKIICSYEGLKDAHSSRLACNCRRIIRPDGLSIALTDAMAADQMGRSGLVGDLDKRTLERYGAAFGVSLISALAQASTSLNKQEAFANATNQLSNNLGQVTQKALEENIDLVPILTIPQGARIQIIPMNDIVFKKPQRSSHEKK